MASPGVTFTGPIKIRSGSNVITAVNNDGTIPLAQLPTITNAKLEEIAVSKLAANALRVAAVNLTANEIKALRATPKTLVAAPGAGKFIELVSAFLQLTFVTPAYGETADNLAIRYTDGSGTIASQTIEAGGFMDITTGAKITNALPKIDQIGIEVNAPLVLHNTGDGEYASGNGTMKVIVVYRVHSF